MEASVGVVRGNVESLMRLLAALESAGIELINEGAASKDGGRGVRLKTRPLENRTGTSTVPSSKARSRS
jgi:hypothetical protein